MKKLLTNKWVKLALSFITGIYAFLIIIMAYSTFMYRLEIDNKMTFSLFYITLNALFFAIMFFTRREIFTSIVSMILLPFVFFILILNFGNWILFIPPFIISAVMFFACRMHETVKTILGTIYLLLYILGLIAFFLIKSLFGGSAVMTKLNPDIPKDSTLWGIYSLNKVEEASKNLVSPDGKYRFYIVDVQDSSSGRVELSKRFR